MTGKLSLATGITIALATCAFALRHDPGESECRAPGAMLAVAPDTTAELRLALNVPAYRLDVVEHGTVTRTIAVAVGMPKYRTPLGTYRIDYAIWNPWWIPPDSWWARNEHREPGPIQEIAAAHRRPTAGDKTKKSSCGYHRGLESVVVGWNADAVRHPPTSRRNRKTSASY